ncbi:MAG: hypothetical protein AMS24_02405 [Chlamydiae bacterium SM23_39]|nr:MAG: hypothetical protein AMS24_02405 [Chlamydiae bacterium SM23_39]
MYKKLIVSVLFIFFIFISSQFIFFMKKTRGKKEKYNIKSLIQPYKEYSLKNIYLAELLDLSIDKPTNIYLFDEKKAENILINHPLIEKAFVKKIKPHTIYVDYTLRKPVAELYDFKNIGIDKNGYIFPIEPFLKKERLVKIYLDEFNLFEKKDSWNFLLNNKKIVVALDILKVFKDKKCFLKMIDVSKLFENSLGKREIVIKIIYPFSIFKNKKKIKCIFPYLIRLNSKDYLKQLNNYFILQDKIFLDYKKQIKKIDDDKDLLKFSLKCIDMRITNLAFIDEN